MKDLFIEILAFTLNTSYRTNCMTVSEVLQIMCHEHVNLYVWRHILFFKQNFVTVSITRFVYLFLVAQSETPPPPHDLEGHKF